MNSVVSVHSDRLGSKNVIIKKDNNSILKPQRQSTYTRNDDENEEPAIIISDLQSQIKRNVWTRQQERLLISWAEKASGHAWLHSKCVAYYKKRNRVISVPTSVLGYVAGTTSLLNSNSSIVARSFIGICAIMAGVLSNLQQMFHYKELIEQHRLSNLRFQSFFRDISCELSLAPEYRSLPIDYIKMRRLDFDKMMEQSPVIPECIIKDYNQAFKYNNTIHKPEVTNTVQTIVTYDQQNKMDEKRKQMNKYPNYYKSMERLQKHFIRWKAFTNLSIAKKKQMMRRDSQHIYGNVEVANSHRPSEMDEDLNTNMKKGLTSRKSGSRRTMGFFNFAERLKRNQLQNVKIEQMNADKQSIHKKSSHSDNSDSNIKDIDDDRIGYNKKITYHKGISPEPLSSNIISHTPEPTPTPTTSPEYSHNVVRMTDIHKMDTIFDTH